MTTTVSVRIDTVGTVRLGPPLEERPFYAPLELAGGMLVTDPFAPDAPPYAEVDDLAGAADWLAGVYGAGAVAAARAALAGARTGTVSRQDPVAATVRSADTPWAPGPHHTSVARLATLRWLANWSPDPLDRALLDLEAGGLLWDLDGIVPDAYAAAERCLRGSAERLLPLAELLRRWSPRQVSDGLVAEAVMDALLAAASLLDGHPRHARLLELAREEAALRESGTRMSWPEERILAKARIHTARSDAGRWIGSVDWAQVPARVLAAAENTVSWWTRDTEGGVLLRVEVAGGPREARPDGLAFRVYHPDQPLPVARGRLTPAPGPGGRRLRGEALLGPLARTLDPADMVVDVFDPAMVSRPRLGRAAARAAQERRAVRHLVSLRRHWSLRDRDALRDWARSGVHAARSLDATGAGPGPDPLGTRVRALTVAADAAAASLGAPAAELPGRGGDIRLTAGAAGAPRLWDPVWRPTVAEWLAVRPDFGVAATARP
ncbi:hypothetical protein [Streptomyces sp. NPDC006997]|uniref:hypothetical protein n=1 Tax=Streptomyces sp. NPDC006997 TaxID=3155356 RepID=UPI0033D9A136